MQPLSGLQNFGGRLTQGSDAKRRSVATAGLIYETPLGFRFWKAVGSCPIKAAATNCPEEAN
jgi:hypothetical protein